MKQHIAWIGTGVMGASMCKHLVTAGHEVHVYSRTKARAQAVVDAGAHWAPSIAEAVAKADIAFSMVGFPSEVESVYFSPQGLLFSNPGTILVDMTTTRPRLAELLGSAARNHKLHFIDAPVSGGDIGARNATLSIMIGGEASVVEKVMPLFDLMGNNNIHQGPVGAGQNTKMMNQITIAGTMIGVCEALIYGYKAGLDLEKVLGSISKGAAGCWTLDNLVPRILNGNFEPGFSIDHFLKDMEIALEEAARLQLSLPGLSLVQQLYRSASALGHGKRGTQALILALQHMNGIYHFKGVRRD